MLRYIPIAAGASGNNVLLEAQDAPVIVLAYTLVCSSAVGVTFTDGVALTGAMQFAANGGASAPFNPAGHFATRSGQPLLLNLSDTVDVAGHLTVQIGGALHL